MGLVNAQNPPDGWTFNPPGTWGTHFVQDTLHILNANTSVKIPAGPGVIGVADMIGPWMQMSSFNAANGAGVQYAPRLFVYGGSGSVLISFVTYQADQVTVSQTLPFTSAYGSAEWVQRSGVLQMTVNDVWGRFEIGLSDTGYSDMWLGGFDVLRLPPILIASNGAFSVTGGAGFVSCALTAATLAETNITTPSAGGPVANSGMLLKYAGLWSFSIRVRTPAALAAGSQFQVQIIDGLTGTTVGGPYFAISEGSTDFFFSPVLSLLGDGFAPGGVGEGYPYVLQIQHNDGANARSFVVKVYATYLTSAPS